MHKTSKVIYKHNVVFLSARTAKAKKTELDLKSLAV